MLKSTTGLGRYGDITDEHRISVEVKAANHRYLDLSIKMPKRSNYFEASIKTLFKKYVRRGKVDLFINYENYTEGNLCLKYNRALAAEYMNCFNRIAEEFDTRNGVKVSALAKFLEVFSMERVSDDGEHLWKILSVALEEAVEMFVRSREVEDEYLGKDLLEKLDYMTGLVDYVEERSPQILGEYQAKLESKVQNLLSTTAIDEGRIAAGVTIFADKIYVDGETIRPRSHIEDTKQELLSGESIGRKLDFTAQEVDRETNIILSKSTDLSISNKAIALKTKIEKIREQIQNIEQADTVRTLKSQGSIP